MPRPLRRSTPHPLVLALRAALYVGLGLAAVATVGWGDRLWAAFRAGALPSWVPLAAPAAFTALVLIYTLDRCYLVWAGQTAPSRALLQVAFCLVFLTLLLPHQRGEMRQIGEEEGPSPAAPWVLLTHGDAAVRCAGCQVLAGPVAPEVREKVHTLAQADPSLEVRRACAAATGRIWGQPASEAAQSHPGAAHQP